MMNFKLPALLAPSPGHAPEMARRVQYRPRPASVHRTTSVVSRCCSRCDPGADPSPSLGACFESLKVEAFVFQATPQPFDHNVVHPPSSAVHRDLHPSVLEDLREGHAGELASLVGVEDLRAGLKKG